ncbi:SDR family NAD(P)-dependent oxidoreductase [Streptomyces auratus]|uniref:Acetoacetyl-CoA reductase n=1 Tax=Streptomyces auratus AGR0001 TaxID=1160718 RepID=J2K780_9ACTN|nr:SDR family oxidoreductase [Streptomyces auratus]QTZ94730.1 SDR family oxidoreductase [Streptomyces auratus AGR0001]
MDLGLTDKRVLITGGTRGIGRATALLYAQEGARVAITYNSSADAAHKLVEELGGTDRAMAVPYELRDPASIVSAVDTVRDAFGGIDVLVANALWFTWGDPGEDDAFEDLDPEKWTRRFRANTEGHMLTAQRVVKDMRANGWGRVVLLSSITAQYGMWRSEIYSSSKAALHGFAKGLMWSQHGVLVNVVAPGATRTEFMEQLLEDPDTREMVEKEIERTPSGRISEPEDIAKLILFLGSGANGNINGEIIHTAGGR